MNFNNVLLIIFSLLPTAGGLNAKADASKIKITIENVDSLEKIIAAKEAKINSIQQKIATLINRIIELRGYDPISNRDQIEELKNNINKIIMDFQKKFFYALAEKTNCSDISLDVSKIFSSEEEIFECASLITYYCTRMIYEKVLLLSLICECEESMKQYFYYREQ